MSATSGSEEPRPHEHAWALRAVDHEDGRAVARFDCPCGQVFFR